LTQREIAAFAGQVTVAELVQGILPRETPEVKPAPPLDVCLGQKLIFPPATTCLATAGPFGAA